MSDSPRWRQGFDAVERQVAPRLESLLRSEQFAVAVGLAARVQRAVEQQASRSTRRVLHQLNLPAGTDVSRILNELGQLKLQVRELTSQLEAGQARRSAATEKTTKRGGSKGGGHGIDARSRRAGRPSAP